MKICGCITEKTVKSCIEVALKSRADILEHRMDFMDEIKDLKELYTAISIPIIATNRSVNCGGLFVGSEEERINYLIEAINAGCSFIDIEIEISERLKKAIIKKAKTDHCNLIISMHDFEKTPCNKKLITILKEEQATGADIGKIVTFANTIEDCHRLLNLILEARKMDFPLISFAIGSLGKITRVMAPFYGAPFTYASINKKAEESQIDISTLRSIFEVLK